MRRARANVPLRVVALAAVVVALALTGVGVASVLVYDAFDSEPACTGGASSIVATYDPKTGAYVTSEPHVTGCIP